MSQRRSDILNGRTVTSYRVKRNLSSFGSVKVGYQHRWNGSTLNTLDINEEILQGYLNPIDVTDKIVPESAIDLLSEALTPPVTPPMKIIQKSFLQLDQIPKKLLRVPTMAAVGNLILPTPGQISENGNIISTYGANRLGVPYCVCHNNKMFNIFAGLPNYTDLYLNHSGNTLFELVFSEWKRLIKKGHLLYRFCDDFGIPVDIDPFAAIYYPYGGVNVELTVDDLPLKGRTRALIQHYFSPYIAYGNTRSWYLAEAGASLLANYEGTYQLLWKDRSKLIRLMELANATPEVLYTMQLGMLADHYSQLSFVSGDSLIGKFFKSGSNAGVPISHRQVIDIPSETIFALQSMGDMSLKWTHPSGNLTVTSSQFKNWFESVSGDISKLQNAFSFAFGANGLYDTAYALTVDSLVRNRVSMDILGNSFEWSLINV